MYKAGICGHFGFGKELINGQTDKTLAVWQALKDAFGEEQVAVLDTCGWQKHPLEMVSGCRKLLEECENVIMMPARRGVKFFPPLFTYLNRAYHRKLHYVVVGGWLADRVQTNKALSVSIKKLDRVYVELPQMRDAMLKLGFKNVCYMPNFRENCALKPNELCYPEGEPYRLCTFSRLARNKGIEEAIQAVRFANKTLGRTAFTLDIYGLPDKDYEKRFEQLKKEFEPFICYKGYISGFGQSTQALKNCFVMLFPTFAEGEGFAGTIIDAYAAGLPVIATDWHYNPEIIRDGIDGVLYEADKPEKLGEILVQAAADPEKYNRMKPRCLERASHFEPGAVAGVLINALDGKEPAIQREAETV